MSREKQLIKNTVIVAIGKICTQFISFFLLPLYTALLSTEEYGTVDLLNTYVSLLIPLFFLQIDQSVFRYLIDVRKNLIEKKKLVSTTLIIVIIQSVIFLVLYLLISKFINNEYKYFLAINVIATMFSNILLQISRGLGDNATYSQGSLVSGAGTVILNVIFIWLLHMGAYGMLLATFLANVLCALFVFVKLKVFKYLSLGKFSKKELKKLWKYSIPLVPNQLSWWIINASDRIIITYVLGVAMNGIYSASNKISSICISFFNIFNMTWSESASMYINDKDSHAYFSNILNISIKLFTSLCIGIIAIMPFVFNYLITGKGYAEAYYQIPILMLATIFNIIVALLGSIYVALKNTKEIAKTSIYAAIINIGTNLLMIKFIGLYAASISTLLAYFAMAIYRFIDVQKYVKIRIEKRFVIISVPIIILILYIYYIRNFYLCIFGLLISIIFALNFNKKILKKIISIVLSKTKKNNNFNNYIEKTMEYDNNLVFNTQINDLKKSSIEAIEDNNKVFTKDDLNELLINMKTYNFKFNNDDYLRDGKYPKILSESSEFMRYVIDKDFNNLSYIDTDIDKDYLIHIMNYTFRKVYYLKKADHEINFDKEKFINSLIIKEDYFNECMKYIDRLN